MDCTPIILAHETPFSIGAVEISPSTRELRNNGKSAILEPRVMGHLISGVLAAIETPTAAHDLPIDVAGTAFQEAVWKELRKIPAGETRSYADIAVAIGDPKATRAVGTANGSNPIAVLVPCHRVIRSDGSLGGYAGGLDRKRKLLAAEGAHWEEQGKLGI